MFRLGHWKQSTETVSNSQIRNKKRNVSVTWTKTCTSSESEKATYIMKQLLSGLRQTQYTGACGGLSILTSAPPTGPWSKSDTSLSCDNSKKENYETPVSFEWFSTSQQYIMANLSNALSWLASQLSRTVVDRLQSILVDTYHVAKPKTDSVSFVTWSWLAENNTGCSTI